MRNNSCKQKNNLKISDEFKIILVSTAVYSIILIALYIYSTYINTGFEIIISDQVIFFNRGVTIIEGLLPYRDVSVDAASLSSYLWAPIVFLSMFVTGNYSTEFVTNDNYLLNESMMLSSYIFRIFFAFCLIISALLLYRLEHKRNNKNALKIAFIYILNPFFLYLFSFWGSDECLLPLLILLPIYLYERGNKTLATLSIILGTGFKYFPILLAPLIWIYSRDWKERSVQTLLFLLGLTAISLPFYLIAPIAFINQFKNPIVSPRNQGLLTLIQNFVNSDINEYNLIIQIVTMSLILLAGLFFFLKKSEWKYHKAVVFLIIFFVIYPKIQVSYFAMIIPFTSICVFTEGKIKWSFLFYYILGTTLGMATDYLLADTQKFLSLETLCWLSIGLFYLSSIFFILYFLFINKQNGQINDSESIEHISS